MVYVSLHHLKAVQNSIKIIQIHYYFRWLGNDELQTIVCRGFKTPHFKNNPPPILDNPPFLKIPETETPPPCLIFKTKFLQNYYSASHLIFF